MSKFVYCCIIVF